VTERLARTSARRPWVIIGAWIAAVLIAFGIVATLLGDALTSEGEVTTETDSKRADALMAERLRPTPADFISEVVIVRAADGTVDGARIEQLAQDLRTAGASFVLTPADEQRLISQDGDAVALPVALDDAAQ
jgi:uncharacterized membrane protein YdfJ with MMPL/SSD domain